MNANKEAHGVPKPFLATLDRNSCTDFFLTVAGDCREDPACMFERMEGALASLAATVVKMAGIGLFTSSGAVPHEQRYCVDCRSCPLGGKGADGIRACPVHAVYVHAVAGAKVEPVWLGGQIVGTVYEDNHARYCYLNDILPEAHLTPEAQTRRVLERAERALQGAGMSFADVVRTWFHLDDISACYDDFNRARNEFFRERGVFDRLVPASTGVGGANSAGAALVANLFAVKPKNGGVTIRAVPSPLQCPALEYGSSFSRAVEVDTPEWRRLFVSGTASISASGESVHVGDIRRQVELTMDVVMAILESRGMAWSDLTRGTAYVKHAWDLPEFDRYCAEHGLSPEPVVVVQNDVCRDDLLFEIELDGLL